MRLSNKNIGLIRFNIPFHHYTIKVVKECVKIEVKRYVYINKTFPLYFTYTVFVCSLA